MRCRGPKRSQKEKKPLWEGEGMDEEIWKELPGDLLEAVIARLPILALIRFRLVCRKWNSLHKSPRFQQLWATFEPQKQPLFFATAGAGYADAEVGALYDPSMKKWCHSDHIPPSCYLSFPSAASAGGLVCRYGDTEGSFWVGNCLTQTWKELPWTPGGGNTVIGMVTLNQDDSQLSAKGYKIIAMDNGYYQVYDSMKDSSTSFWGIIPFNIKLPPSGGYDRRTVTIDTVVYFLTWKPDGIISYDAVSGTWEQFFVPTPPNTNGSLAECGGRILLAGKVQEENSSSFSICVWELETAMLRWKEIDRMPGSWCCRYPNPSSFACLGNRRVIVMLLSTYYSSCIVMYDVVNREWSEAPPFTLPCGPCRRPRITNGVGFFPCLSASP